MDSKEAAAKAAGWLRNFADDGGYSSNYIAELQELYGWVLCATREQRALLKLLEAMLGAETYAGLNCSYAARVAERLCHVLGTSPVRRTGEFGASL